MKHFSLVRKNEQSSLLELLETKQKWKITIQWFSCSATLAIWSLQFYYTQATLTQMPFFSIHCMFCYSKARTCFLSFVSYVWEICGRRKAENKCQVVVVFLRWEYVLATILRLYVDVKCAFLLYSDMMKTRKKSFFELVQNNHFVFFHFVCIFYQHLFFMKNVVFEPHMHTFPILYDFKKWVAHVKRVMVNGASFDVYKQGRWCDLRFVLTIYFITQPKENEKKVV